MASELDDVREQLATVNRRLAAVEQQLSAEAGLRAAMDTDQSNLTIRLDAQDNLLRALSITQTDQHCPAGRLRQRWAESRAAFRPARMPWAPASS